MIRFYTLFRVLVLTLLGSVLVACGGKDGDKITLSQTISYEVGPVGSLVLHYPEGWVGSSREQLLVYVATNETSLLNITLDGGDGTTIQTGQAAGIATMIPAMVNESLGLPADASRVDVATTYVNRMIAGMLKVPGTVTVTLNDVEEFQADGKPAFLRTGTVTPSNGVAVGVIVAATEMTSGASSLGTGIIVLTTRAGETNQFTTTARAMIGQMEFRRAS